MMPGPCTALAGRRSNRNFAGVICLLWPILLQANSLSSRRAHSLLHVQSSATLTVLRNVSDSGPNVAQAHDPFQDAIVTEPQRAVPSQLRPQSTAAEVTGNSTRKKVEKSGSAGWGSLFDSFFCAYWGSVFIIFFVAVPTVKALIANKDGQEGMRALRAMMKSRSGHLEAIDSDNSVELHETIWALNLVAAAGQAKFPNGWRVPVYLVAILSISVGVLQCAILWILVHDISPDTKPISEHWTVNCMKWCMVLVISMSVCGDLEECKMIVLAIYKIDGRKLYVGRWLPAVVAVWQYCISVYVVRAGTQVILSFERSPDIVYSSLAVTFLTHIDNLAWTFLETILNLDVDFRISMGDMRPLPDFYSWAVMFCGFFPMLLGFFLTGRAYLTNEMFTFSAF